MRADTREFPSPSAAPDFAAELPVLVLPEHALFPGAVQTLPVTTAAGRALVDSLVDAPSPFLAVFLERDELAAADPARAPVGILARVMKSMGHASGNHGLALEGLARLRLDGPVVARPVQKARVSPLPDPPASDAQFGDLALRLRQLVKSTVQHMPEMAEDSASQVDSVGDPARLADLSAANLDLTADERARLVAAVDLRERLALAVEILARRLAVLERESAELAKDPLRQLWPFEPTGAARLAREEAAGRISADEARRIREFVELGYTVWEGLIPAAEIDALLADIASIRRHPGHFLITGHREGFPYRYSGPDFDAYENIFDLYVNFESARRVCYHPTILRFLELLFDARPVAFQQLLFQRSNEHPLHQDTAYVCVDQPLQMVATWIALEDVVPGRGELTYFEKSHRIPHHFFRDGSKRFSAGRDQPGPYVQHLEDSVRALGCPKRDFLAKKGDVFLWSADLVHGSNKRTRPEHETRRSCVTHYCPETTRPFWFRILKGHRNLEEAGPRALLASSYYRLPRGTGLARPAFLMPEQPKKPAPSEPKR